MIGLRFVAHLWNYVMLRQGALQLLSADVVCPMQNCSRQAAGSMHAWYEGPAGTDCMLLDGSDKGSGMARTHTVSVPGTHIIYRVIT